MSEAFRAVFLSYASQDADAARKICEALRAAGIEVWFDQNQLVGGDAWDQKIRRQIKECALFIPIVSANTQARPEGYFRLEWKLADDRTHLMARGMPFLLPVCIDGTKDWDAIVPDSFMTVQWTRLPIGETTPAFCERVRTLLSGTVGGPFGELRAGPAAGRAPGQRPGLQPKLSASRRWLIPAVLGAVAIATLAIWQPWRKPAPSHAAASAPLSEASRLVAKAREIFETGDELNRETYYLAEDLVKRAVALDPADAAAWALYADISFLMTWHHVDDSDQRKDTMRRQADRARSLNPELTEVQIAFANARLLLRQDALTVERDLLALAKREPANWRVQQSLGITYRNLDRTDDAIRAMQRAHELSNGLPRASADLVNFLLRRERFAEAEAVIAQTLPQRTNGRLLVFDAIIKAQWRGDLPAATAALAQWPDWLLLEDRGAILASRTWLWSRQPEKALQAAQRFRRDYLSDSRYTGPRAALSARAHEVAGHVEAAQADWKTVIQVCDRELATVPGNGQALYWKAWALARLGNHNGALSICAQLEQRNLLVSTRAAFGVIDVPHLLVTVGRIDQAIDDLKTRRSRFDQLPVTRAELEFDPAFEPLRADPRYQELLQSAPAPEPKTTAAPTTDKSALAKSVAVLAFKNSSDDKGNEYFSDGISEELLNVLAKVPGLKVTARTSAFHFKGKDTPIPEIAKQLGVAYVVEGSVQKAGNRVRITAQLVKASDGFHVWSDKFDRELKDIFAVQDEIAGLIAKNLSLKLGANTRSGPIDPEVFRLYLEGRQRWNQRTRESLDQAQTLFERAIRLDPTFALAHAGLADVWVVRATTYSLRFDDWKEHMSRVREGVDRALALDSNLAEAHATRGLELFLRRDGQGDAIVAAYQRALELNPNSATAHGWFGRLLFNRGKIEPGLAEAEVATRLDPLSAAFASDYSSFLVVARRWNEALAVAQRALVIQPDFNLASIWRAAALTGLDRRPEALAILRPMAKREPYGGPFYQVLFISQLALAGDRATAEELAKPILGDLSRIFPETNFLLHVALNRIEDAFTIWERCDLKAAGGAGFFVASDFDAVREDPRFLRKFEQAGILADYREGWSHVLAWQKQSQQR